MLDIQTLTQTGRHISVKSTATVTDCRSSSGSGKDSSSPLAKALRALVSRSTVGSAAAKNSDTQQFARAHSRSPISFTAVAHRTVSAHDSVLVPAEVGSESHSVSWGSSSRFNGERRGYPRRASRCFVTICRPQDEVDSSAYRQAWKMHNSRIRGQLADISRSGISFLSWHPFKIGEPLRLRITNPLYDLSIETTGHVLRQEHAADGSWHAICHFEEALSYQQIDFFGKHLFVTDIV